MKKIFVIGLLFITLTTGCGKETINNEDNIQNESSKKDIQTDANAESNSNKGTYDVDIELINSNYEKALEEIDRLNEKKNITEDMLFYGPKEANFTQTFEDKTTVTVSEKGYGIAINDQESMKIIDVIDGERTETEIDLNEIKDKLNDDESE